jgi:hypothetical protein
MRTELSEFVSRMEKERPEDSGRSVTEELNVPITSFGYTSLKNEIAIGGVYLRVFNSLGGGARVASRDRRYFLVCEADHWLHRFVYESECRDGRWVDQAA